MFEDYKIDPMEKTQDHIGSISRIEHKDMSSSSDESPDMTELQNLQKSTEPLLRNNTNYPVGQVILLNKFNEKNQNNQSLNIESNNSVAENISLQQVNKSFPNIESRKPGVHISPLLSGKKKSQPCTLKEIGNLNQRIDYYERRKAQLESKINEQLHIKNKRESVKQNSLLYNLTTNPNKELTQINNSEESKSANNNRSFQKRENADSISLIEKLRKTSEIKNLSLIGELEPNTLKDNFADTSNLKCKELSI
jgi:hypothetical protein